MRGVIFDWDGVIIDSSRQHKHSWELLAAEMDKTLPEGHFQLGFGKKNQEIIPQILRWTDDLGEIEAIADRKENIYRKLIHSEGVCILPGARELLHALRNAEVPKGLGTSTPRSNLDAIFATTDIENMFDTIVCGDDVKNGKPAPDVFLQVAERLCIEPSECVVIEDAHVGIEAAQRAGMKVLAVATTHPLTELGHADAAVVSLKEVSVEFLQCL